MPLFSHLLAQMDNAKLVSLNDGSPTLNDPPSYGMAWVIAFALTVLIIAITFKTSKRNNLERD
jgi:hypothetical protein